MNPPGWHAPRGTTCGCDDCHIRRYPDLAYAIAKCDGDEDGWEMSADSFGREDMPEEVA